MKPDAFMPMYGDDFIRGVKGQPVFVKWAYLLAVWHYWSHNHCEGLDDNDDSLRDICEIRKDDEWEIARAIIFDNNKFFNQDHEGRWHQKRASEEWVKSVAKYNAAVKGGQNRAKSMSAKQRSAIAAKGAVARWQNAC